jgi:putative sterol carrier protein
VPYHLAYFDRTLLVDGVERGDTLPADERWLMDSEAKVNAWNARMFARRPAEQSLAQSVAEMRAAREALRQATAGMTDADLARPTWNPFFGWDTLEGVLGGGIAHAWSHLNELRIRLKRLDVAPPATATHRALGFYVAYMARIPDPKMAAQQRFTAVFDFDGPGGGAWTVRVGDGQTKVAEERAAKPDLVMRMAPETWTRLMGRMSNPMLLMLTGKNKVKGFSKMGTFGTLFPSNQPDRPWRTTTELVAATA